MFVHAEDLERYERIEDTELTEKELKDFAYMVVHGAVIGKIENFISR